MPAPPCAVSCAQRVATVAAAAAAAAPPAAAAAAPPPREAHPCDRRRRWRAATPHRAPPQPCRCTTPSVTTPRAVGSTRDTPTRARQVVANAAAYTAVGWPSRATSGTPRPSTGGCRQPPRPLWTTARCASSSQASPHRSAPCRAKRDAQVGQLGTPRGRCAPSVLSNAQAQRQMMPVTHTDWTLLSSLLPPVSVSFPLAAFPQ